MTTTIDFTDNLTAVSLDELLTNVLEEGLTPAAEQELARRLEEAKTWQAIFASTEASIKDLWRGLYDNGEVPKHWENDAGLKIDVREAGAPKETVTPGHWVAGDVEELIQKYGIEVLVSQGFIRWVPESKTTSAGSRASVAVTLPKPAKR